MSNTEFPRGRRSLVKMRDLVALIVDVIKWGSRFRSPGKIREIGKLRQPST
jgi:hypothetical protein